MIAEIDIIDGLKALLQIIADVAEALNMTPLTLIVILVAIFGFAVGWAQQYNARRDMEKAIRKANQPPPLRKP